MKKVLLWFSAYLLAFTLFVGASFHAYCTLNVLAVTSVVTCAATFVFTFCLHDRIARRPGLMLLFLPLLISVLMVGAEILLFHAREKEIDRRVEKIRATTGASSVHDHESFSEALLDLAMNGDVGAQRRVGWCYLDGYGVEKDVCAAVKWYRLAAEHGDLQSQFRLGWFYNCGLGLTADAREAESWLRMAAERGEPWAQTYLGLSYLRGFCGKAATKDTSAAARWLGIASKKGIPHAMELRAMIARQERLHQRKWWILALVLGIVAIITVFERRSLMKTIDILLGGMVIGHCLSFFR